MPESNVSVAEIKIISDLGIGCGSVGRVVASDPRGLLFEFNHQ